MPFKDIIPSVKTANKSKPTSNVRLEGYLMKQKHSRCKSWLKRYFVLYSDEIRYYKNKNDSNCLAVISLNHYSLVPDAQPLTSVNQKQWRYNTFCLVSDDDSKFDWPDYLLQASSPEKRQAWVDCLQNNVCQSTSVLEKWLDRLQLPHNDPSFYNSENTSSNLLSPQSSVISSTSNILLPPSHQHGLRNHKSVESFNTFTSLSSAGKNNKRRPSDFTSSRSSDLSSRILSSKVFNWVRPRSSTSSIASSTAESLYTDIADSNSSELLATPKTIPQKRLEFPIIHPSEYNHDDDPTLHANDTTTTNFYYASSNAYQQKQA